MPDGVKHNHKSIKLLLTSIHDIGLLIGKLIVRVNHRIIIYHTQGMFLGSGSLERHQAGLETGGVG